MSSAKGKSGYPQLRWLKLPDEKLQKYPKLHAHLHAVFFRRWKHWLFVAILIFGGVFISHTLEKHGKFMSNARYACFQWISNLATDRSSFQDCVVVLVDDNTYYNGDPKQRSPIKRDFIARLVERINDANPALIAIDFDLRSSDPTGKQKSTTELEGSQISLSVEKEYFNETAIFVKLIDKISQNCNIVLPDTFNVVAGKRVNEADCYDGFVFSNEKVSSGYIQLDDDDRRIIPKIQELANGSSFDSFSIAIVRAFRPRVIEDELWHHEQLARFIPVKNANVKQTSEILDDQQFSKLKADFANKIVIIGGGWSDRAIERGKRVDFHSTPEGEMHGAIIHANYVESILRDNYLSPFHHAWILELVFSLAIAYALALPTRPLWKKIAAVAAIVLFPFVANYFFMHNLRMSFDVVVIAALLVGHILVEKSIEIYKNHRRFMQLEQAKLS